AGEPDFDTPENIGEAAISAIKKGFTHYTTNSGIIELKEAIVEKLKKDNNIEYNTSEIIVSTGAKQCLFNALLTICNPGDEVLLPIPCWVSYTEQIKFAQAVPVFIPTHYLDFLIFLDLPYPLFTFFSHFLNLKIKNYFRIVNDYLN
ncbi:unnamed protein product, partial [marine sediment metagenome]